MLLASGAGVAGGPRDERFQLFQRCESCLHSAFNLFRMPTSVSLDLEVLALLVLPCQAATELSQQPVTASTASSSLTKLFDVLGRVQASVLDDCPLSWDIESLPLACRAVLQCCAQLPVYSTRTAVAANAIRDRSVGVALHVQQHALLALSQATAACARALALDPDAASAAMLLRCKAEVASVASLVLRMSQPNSASFAADVFARLFSMFGDIITHTPESSWQLHDASLGTRSGSSKSASSLRSPTLYAPLLLMTCVAETLTPLASEHLLPAAVDVLVDLAQFTQFLEHQRKLPAELALCVAVSRFDPYVCSLSIRGGYSI
jgi:hypothetical protein